LFLTLPPPSPPLFPYTTLFRSLLRLGVLPLLGRLGPWFVASSFDRRPGPAGGWRINRVEQLPCGELAGRPFESVRDGFVGWRCRSEEHTSELQSRENLVCRLLL